MGKSNFDLSGRRFGRLLVIERSDDNIHKQSMWKCVCDCGKTTIVQGGNLKYGVTKSCGCLRAGRKWNRELALSERDMRGTKSESLDRLQRDDAPYKNLANAIVCVAADDYRTALKESNESLQKEVESFFLSDWFKVLSRLNPAELIHLLSKEHANNLDMVYVS